MSLIFFLKKIWELYLLTNFVLKLDLNTNKKIERW